MEGGCICGGICRLGPEGALGGGAAGTGVRDEDAVGCAGAAIGTRGPFGAVGGGFGVAATAEAGTGKEDIWISSKGNSSSSMTYLISLSLF